MSDLNMLMRDQARAGLQTQLDAAVTDGNTEAARKISDDIAKLAVQTAPKAPPFGDAEIRAELNKQEWFGVDPKKSGRAIALGRDMDPKKFPSAEAFATALIKAVDEENKPAPAAGGEGEGTEEDEGEDVIGEQRKAPAKPRRSDSPGEGDANQRPVVRRTTGPWAKITDAPPDTQKEIRRQADKFVPASAPKEQREKFIASALGIHYAQHQQRTKGK